MTPLRLSQIARWCEARLLGEDVLIDAIGTDSRRLPEGALFVALRGENFDGHEFCGAAERAGARALLVARPVESALPQLLCADTELALGEIAAEVQAQRQTQVLALTGSNGKTTVKTLLLGILSRHAPSYANPGNRNNEIGLPLAVLDAPEDARFAIYEMGAGKPGDIAYLTSVARPSIALVNNVAPAHLQRMGTLLGVAQTKGAIYEALPADGVAVINADDAFCEFFADLAKARRVVRFGLEQSADVRAEAIVASADGSAFTLRLPMQQVAVQLPLPGRHNILNALAAAAMAHAAGVPAATIAAGLAAATPVAGRQQASLLMPGVALIDDSYNANPGSVAAAIETLAAGAGEAWLVLGDMAELGEGAPLLHAEVGAHARRAGLAALWTVGTLSREASRAFGDGARHFSDQSGLIAALREALRSRTGGAPLRVLVKGSRSSAMERVIAALRQTPNSQETGHVA